MCFRKLINCARDCETFAPDTSNGQRLLYAEEKSLVSEGDSHAKSTLPDPAERESGAEAPMVCHGSYAIAAVLARLRVQHDAVQRAAIAEENAAAARLALAQSELPQVSRALCAALNGQHDGSILQPGLVH